VRQSALALLLQESACCREGGLEEVVEEKKGSGRRPDGRIEVRLQAGELIPNPKTSNGGKAGVNRERACRTTRAMRVATPLLTNRRLQTQMVATCLKPLAEARGGEKLL
jgi:hypothetical protein